MNKKGKQAEEAKEAKEAKEDVPPSSPVDVPHSRGERHRRRATSPAPQMEEEEVEILEVSVEIDDGIEDRPPAPESVPARAPTPAPTPTPVSAPASAPYDGTADLALAKVFSEEIIEASLLAAWVPEPVTAPPLYDPRPMVEEVVEGLVDSLRLMQPSPKPKAVSLLDAVAFEEMATGTTRWAKEVPLDGSDPGELTWVRIAPTAHRTNGHFASVTRNHTYGPRIEYFQKKPIGSELVGGAIQPMLKTGSSRSLGHVELEGGIVLAQGGGDGESRNTVQYTLGVGVTTGAGIKDDSASIKVLGCGLTLGRKLSVSFLDSEIGIDLGKINKDRKDNEQYFWWEPEASGVESGEVRRNRRWSQEPWALDGQPPTTLANARALAGQIMADAKRGRAAAIVEVLDSEDIDAQTGALLLAAGDLANGNTAVMLCAKNGHADCCRVLLARGADPQGKNRHGQTAVDIAKAANHMDVVDVLHEYW